MTTVKYYFGIFIGSALIVAALGRLLGPDYVAYAFKVPFWIYLIAAFFVLMPSAIGIETWTMNFIKREQKAAMQSETGWEKEVAALRETNLRLDKELQEARKK